MHLLSALRWRLALGAAVALIAIGVVLAVSGGGGRIGTVGPRASAPNEQRAAPGKLVACGVPGLTTGTRPPHSVILSDRQAACLVRRSSFEPSTDNLQANHRVPTAAELRTFRAVNTNPYKDHVTGDFTGTTDEILQWAAWKWGIGPDVLRAVAYAESRWNQASVNDDGQSFGLMQIKRTASTGTWPLSQESTAFNVDYYGAVFRYYYDGWAKWLGPTYRAGDLWASVGSWFEPDWHARAPTQYADRVRSHEGQQSWRQLGL